MICEYKWLIKTNAVWSIQNYTILPALATYVNTKVRSERKLISSLLTCYNQKDACFK